MNDKVFYSWQSDLPNPTNRGFIQKALEDAAKVIRDDDSVKVEPVIDRDTAGVAGSPDIANTIFTKIEHSQVFVCDVSIINQGATSRLMPNPNVLIELGYALKALRSERIIMVMNISFGGPELLPFDLSKKRIITYTMPQICEDRSTERKLLQSKLEEALRTIFTEIKTQPFQETAATKLKRYLVDEKYRIELDDLIQDETRKLYEYLSQINSLPPVTNNNDPHKELAKELERQTESLRNLMIIGCYYGEEKHKQLWRKSLEQILNPIGTNLLALKRYPALVLLYAGGISALIADKYGTLKSLLVETKYIDNQEKALLITHFSASELINLRDAQKVFDQDKKMTPISNHLFESLRIPLTEIITGPPNYEEYFDRFEYLLALIRFHIAQKTGTYYVSHGRFVWKYPVRIRNNIIYREGIVDDIGTEAREAGNNWPPLRAGLFDGNLNHFLDTKENYDKNLEKIYYSLLHEVDFHGS